MSLPKIPSAVFTMLVLFFGVPAWCQIDGRYEIVLHETRLNVSDGGMEIEDRIHIAFRRLAGPMDTVVLYINPEVKNLKIRQEGQGLVFEKNKERLAIPVRAKRSTSINLSYFLPHTRSRSYYAGSTQLYLLGDYRYLAHSSLITAEEPVTFDITVNGVNVFYPEKGVSRFRQTSRRRPDIVAGDFATICKTVNNKSYRYHFPEDLQIDSLKLKYVHNSVVPSDSLFERLLARISDSLDIFFVHRTGGHSLSDAHLMLDQAYIESGNLLPQSSVIAHEIAHCWWGNAVESQNVALMESLAEYYASVYLAYCGDAAALLDFYASKSVEIEIDQYPMIPVEDVRPQDGNRYRTIAYKVIPKLFYQLERSIGMDYMLSRMKNLFFAVRGDNRDCSFSDLYAALDDGSAAWQEIYSYMKAQRRFPNYVVNVIVHNEFSLFSREPVYRQNIPVEVKFTSGKTLRDTILLEPGKMAVGKYTDSIADVIVDPDFTLMQSRVSDDTWVKPEYRIFPKLEKKDDKKYHDFAGKCMFYLFSIGDSVTLEDITDDDVIQKHLVKISESRTKLGMKLVGYELFLRHRDSATAEFRILILYEFQDKTVKGYIDGLINEGSEGIKLDRLDRIRL